jgi:UDP-glucose 4-epimerase
MGESRTNLITGGAGFIGSHLAEALLDLGQSVRVIDDLSTGRIQNIAHLKKHERFRCSIEPVQNETMLTELMDECDVIYHLAASVGVKLIVDQPSRTIRNNVENTGLVLKLAAEKNKLVVLTSTSEVYGKASSFPFDEEQDILLGCPQRSRWSYACSKALDEFLALAYFKEKQLPVVIARLFNTVGPRQTDAYGMVIPAFVKQALAGEPITVYGSGRQSRCFAHVRDVVKALIALAATPAAIGQIINIGSDREISIEDLAKRVKEITRSSSPIVKIPYDEAYEEGFEDMQRRVPNLVRLVKLTGAQPAGDLTAIIQDVVRSVTESQSSAANASPA